MNEETVYENIEQAQEESQVSQEQNEAMKYGWKPYETYIEEGGDPDLFNGAKAFLKGYKDRQERNQYRNEVGELKGSIDKLTNGFIELQEREKKKYLSELEAAKKAAKENLDMDAYDVAQKQIDEIKAAPTTQQQVPAGEPEFVKKFRSSHPVLDHQSPEFDSFVNRLVESGVNEKLMLYRAKNYSDPPESTFQEWMQNELATVQNEFGKRKAPTRKAPTVATPSKKSNGKQVDAVKLLDDAEKSVYKHLLAASEDAAKNFLKAQTEGR